jgi:hypothetical protein
LSSIKVQSLSNKLTEVAVIAAVLVVFLISMQIVYGLAGSLKELENEVKNETGYRSELIDFINESFSNDTRKCELLTYICYRPTKTEGYASIAIVPHRTARRDSKENNINHKVTV